MVNHKKTCERCGDAFETDRGQRRKCYRCQPARLSILPDGTTATPRVNVPVTPETPPAAPREPGIMETATRAELVKLEAVESFHGALALRFAQSMDVADIAPAGITSLGKQLDTIMDKIRARAPREPDEIDELEDELARRRSEAT